MAVIPGITTQQQLTQTTPAETSRSTLGQDDFLTLLVAQMQNQDPLNPADATEFTAQLAQYSQLEQLFNLNESMDQLSVAQNNSQRISALSLIGKEVLVEGSSFSLADASVELGYRVDGLVGDAELQIHNAEGKSVAAIALSDLTEGNHTLTWNGKDDQGNPLEPGTYSAIIKASTAGDGDDASVVPLVRTEVTGVNLEGAAPMLVTTTGEYTIEAIHGAFDASGLPAAASSPEDGDDAAHQTAETATTQESVSAATDGAGIIESESDQSTPT